MSFRRLPFSFAATNPAERQAELMRRFGVPAENTMLVENYDDPLTDGFSHSSPRLQHRIPRVMTDGHPIRVEREGYGVNVDSPKAEPKVRVIPIHVEGRDDVKPQNVKHRNLSGSSIPINKTDHSNDYVRQRTNSGSFSRLNSESPSQSIFQPDLKDSNNDFHNPKDKTKVYNIPIFVEGQDKRQKLKQCRSVPIQKEVLNKNLKFGNGPCVSKSATEPLVSDIKTEPDFKISLKKIESILDEFKSYEKEVENFLGVQGDKQYRYLDEMLTRSMLNLDDVETFGNEEVRKSRKAAVKRIQNAINVLESKVQPKQDETIKCESDEIPNVEVQSTTEMVEKAEDEVMDTDVVIEEELDKNITGNSEKELELETNVKDHNNEENIVDSTVIEMTVSESNSGSTNENNVSHDELQTKVPISNCTSDKEVYNNEISNIDSSSEKIETCVSPNHSCGDPVSMDCIENSSSITEKTVDVSDVEMSNADNESLEPVEKQTPLPADA